MDTRSHASLNRFTARSTATSNAVDQRAVELSPFNPEAEVSSQEQIERLRERLTPAELRVLEVLGSDPLAVQAAEAGVTGAELSAARVRIRAVARELEEEAEAEYQGSAAVCALFARRARAARAGGDVAGALRAEAASNAISLWAAARRAESARTAS